MKAKWIANAGFFAAQVLVITLGTTAHVAPLWLVITLTLLACVAIFATGVANYAEGLDKGSKNVWAALRR